MNKFNFKVTFGTKLGKKYYSVCSVVYLNQDVSFIKRLKEYYKCCRYTKILKIEEV